MSQTAGSASAAGAGPAGASPPSAAVELLRWSDYQRYAQAEWRGWVHRDWSAVLAGTDPLAWLASSGAVLRRDRPSSRIWRLRVDGERLTVKHVITAFSSAGLSPASALKRRFGRSRAIRTLRIGCAMSRDGIHVPGVALAARRRTRGGAEDLLIMRHIGGWTLAGRLKRAPDVAALRALLRTAATQIARFHRKGYIHGDLLPANLKLTADDEALVFLDNDRTRRQPWLGRTGARRRNIAQMLYRLLRRHRWSDVKVLAWTYFDEMGISEAGRRRAIAAMLVRVRRRLEGAPRVFPNRPPILVD